jgi:hypothetical protein
MYKVAVIILMQCKKVMKCILFNVMKEHSHDFKSVVVLQNSGSEACVTSMGDGTEEINIKVEVADIKVEESVDIKEENPEVITFPPVRTEPEVSVWGLCVRHQQLMLPRPFTATKRELLKLHLIIFVYVPYILYGLFFRPTNA